MPVLEATRRQFIRSAAMAAAAAVIGSRPGVAADPPKPPGGLELPVLPGVKWDKAPCRFCGTGCHVQVGVKDGKVVAVSGDRLAEVNKGLLCVKGYHVGHILYGPDRLTTPMLRKNGKLEPITWDVAIETIAKRIAVPAPPARSRVAVMPSTPSAVS